MATGEVELQVDELEIVSRSTPLPFQLDEEGVDETLRLRYRWLDLRTERMQRNLRLRASVVVGDPSLDGRPGFRRHLDAGSHAGHARGRSRLPRPGSPPARDLLRAGSVAAALQAGAHGRRLRPLLPDRHLLAGRGPSRRSPVRVPPARSRARVSDARRRARGARERSSRPRSRRSAAKLPRAPFPRLSYAEAMLRYGSDKPDLRFGLEIQDATDVTRGSEFGVFASASTVRYLVVPKPLSRGELAQARGLREGVGCEGPRVPRVRRGGRGAVSDREVPVASRAGRLRAAPGSTVLFVADEVAVVERVLGALRLHLGRELGLVDETRDAFHWLLDFPLFQLDDETGSWTFVHHPFTEPARGSRGADRARPGERRSACTTTSSGTAGSSAPARSGSTARTFSSRCSEPWG